MPCPTCSHTMQNLGLDSAGRRVFWCPRCGTLREEVSDNSSGIPAAQTNDEAPKLVPRCREFEETVPNGAGVIPLWQRLGIAESIYPATERP